MKNSYEKNADKIYSEINVDEISNLERRAIKNAISDIIALLSTKSENLSGLLWLKQPADNLYKNKLIKKANTLDNMDLKQEILYNIDNIKNNDIILKTIKLNLYLDYPEQAVERELDLVYNKRYRFDCEELDIEPSKPNIEELRKKWGSGWYNYSTDIWKDTKELEKRLNSTIKKKIRLNQRVNERAKDLKDLTDYGDYAIRRILLTESARAITLADMQSFVESGAIGIEINSYLDNRTSYICKSLNNKVFYFNEINNFKVQLSKDKYVNRSIEGIVVGKTAPPFHPHCRTIISPVFEKKLEKIDKFFNSLDSNSKRIVNNDLSRMPYSHRKAINDYVEGIEIDCDLPNRYNPQKNILYINPNELENGVFGHECAHVFETKLGLFQEDSKFLDIVKDGIDLSDVEKVYDASKHYVTNQKVVILSNNKFVTEYQGRLYDTKKVPAYKYINGIEYINPKALREYFSIGYQTFLYNPELLKEKDLELFNFIKELKI